MERQEERNWHLVRNNNGEWISSEHVAYLDGLSATIYRSRAVQYGLPLSPQTNLEGETWYYKREIEGVEAAMDPHKQEVKPRKLKITPSKQKLSDKEINDMVMSMLKPKTNGHFEALNEKSQLWQALENNPPQWWKNLLEDKELYVEIRKDNYANVYYYGGNVALVRWTGGRIIAETHQKYLGDEEPVRIKTVKQKEREIKVYEYRNCMDKFQSKEGLEEIKRHIRETYHDIHGKNGRQETRETRDKDKHVYTSNEKSVQGELKLRFPNRYIDSEFAYRYRTEGKKNIRFDLVELREGKLVFIELKLITDTRLRIQKGEPEIIEQMNQYCDFISKHTKELKDYYSKLLRIKKRIGLWNGEIKIEEVSLKPELLVVNTYKDKMSDARNTRKEAIERLKEKTEFETIIKDYPGLCK